MLALTPIRMQNMGNLPEYTISSFVCFPGSQNPDISIESSLHQIAFPIKFSGLTRPAVLQHLSGWVKSDRYLSFLNKGIFEQSQVKRDSSEIRAVQNLRAPVGVKKAGIPAPPARKRSAIVPWGHNSTAISPFRYFFSKTLLFPR